ncbi:MAG: hypothetical protein KAR80_03980, partial [Rhodospirillaceae bacterium]|nr:hypothetical protein [Rhodospirillaceae bacterium]
MNVTPDISKQVVPCWSCHGPLQAGSAFCSTCNAVQPPAGVDHFVRLGMAVDFDVDTSALDGIYFGLQRTLHPDRFATST